MRKIIVLSFITLDGVMQAPGGPDEDTSGGFSKGGWVTPYFDEAAGKVMEKQMKPADLLLGRKTFEIFAGYWPEHEAEWAGINYVTKYVMSGTLKKTDWKNSVIISSLADIEKLRNSEGTDIQVHGSNMEPGGLVIYSKLLEEGRFRLPSKTPGQESLRIEWLDLVMMVDGVMDDPSTRLRRLKRVKF